MFEGPDITRCRAAFAKQMVIKIMVIKKMKEEALSDASSFRAAAIVTTASTPTHTYVGVDGMAPTTVKPMAAFETMEASAISSGLTNGPAAMIEKEG